MRPEARPKSFTNGRAHFYSKKKVVMVFNKNSICEGSAALFTAVTRKKAAPSGKVSIFIQINGDRYKPSCNLPLSLLKPTRKWLKL